MSPDRCRPRRVLEVTPLARELIKSFCLLPVEYPQGDSVTNAALSCGYDSTSAFIAAFKSLFGFTPVNYSGTDRSRTERGNDQEVASDQVLNRRTNPSNSFDNPARLCESSRAEFASSATNCASP